MLEILERIQQIAGLLVRTLGFQPFAVHFPRSLSGRQEIQHGGYFVTELPPVDDHVYGTFVQQEFTALKSLW